MRTLSILMFVFMIPFLGALGHDLYVTYKDQDFAKPMMFSDIGYLWTTYEPTSFEWTKQNVEPSTWTGFLTPALEQTTVVVTGIPVALIGLLMLLMKFIDFSTLMASKKPGRGKGFAFKGGLDKKQQKFDYKRKKS